MHNHTTDITSPILVTTSDILISTTEGTDSTDVNSSSYFSSIRKGQTNINMSDELTAFKEKSLYLSTHFGKVSPRDFVRTIFPEGTLQRVGEFDDGKPNAIIMALTNKLSKDKSQYNMKPFIIFDDLVGVEKMENAEFAVMVPISYVGRRRYTKNASQVCAMTFDIDGVSPDHLKTMLYQVEQSIIPTPTYIVNSGHGVHLHYVFKYPISARGQNLKELTRIKYALTDILWTKYTSSIEDTQYQSITQGFRVPGSLTKFGEGFKVEAFEIGNKITLHEMLAHLKQQAEIIELYALEPTIQREEKKGLAEYNIKGFEHSKPNFNSKEEKIKRIKAKYDVSGFETISKLSMAEAKKKYPEWHEKIVVNKEPKGSWTCNPKVYEWWLRKTLTEIKVGKRYHSVSILAVLAKKCSIEKKILKGDAMKLLAHFNELESADRFPFTMKDINTALKMYSSNYIKYPIWAIAKKTGVEIKKNKRNGLSRTENLMNARLKQSQYDNKNGTNWRDGNGPKPKEELVVAYISENPGLTPTEYAIAMGVSRTTIYKYLTKE